MRHDVRHTYDDVPLVAGRTTIQKLVELCPERADEFWARWEKGWLKDEVVRLIEELREAQNKPVVTLVSDRVLSVDGQRERTSREIDALKQAERKAAERKEYVRASEAYYAKEAQAFAEARSWAMRGKVVSTYSPTQRFQQEMRDEVDG